LKKIGSGILGQPDRKETFSIEKIMKILEDCKEERYESCKCNRSPEKEEDSF